MKTKNLVIAAVIALSTLSISAFAGNDGGHGGGYGNGNGGGHYEGGNYHNEGDHHEGGEWEHHEGNHYGNGYYGHYKPCCEHPHHKVWIGGHWELNPFGVPVWIPGFWRMF